MPNPVKDGFLDELRHRTGSITKLARSNSLYDVSGGAARIYIRYSKVHARDTTFYGLRQEDLQQLEARFSFIVFLWDEQAEPLFLPFVAYEEVFRAAKPAPDGQYKAQVCVNAESMELYLARAGRFNLEGLSGWSQLMSALESRASAAMPDLSHSQVQSILSAIGGVKGYDIWVPRNDRERLHRNLTGEIQYRDELPVCFEEVREIMQEVDVLWLRKGSNHLCGLFEVEHTTPIYSALLRFNDVHLVTTNPAQSFRIIAHESRRGVFARQLNRPTFRTSGLNQICTFLEYRNVYSWFTRVCGKTIPLNPLDFVAPAMPRHHELPGNGAVSGENLSDERENSHGD